MGTLGVPGGRPEGVLDFDVIVVGSGLAGALIAEKVASEWIGDTRPQVLILEAGDVVRSRRELISQFATASSKIRHAPYVGLAAPQPYYDELRPVSLQHPPRVDQLGRDYYVEHPDVPIADLSRSELFLSYYLNIAGGTTWQWQGLWLRMLPNDFRLKTTYGVGCDWPIDYDDLEPWYSAAEAELGVSGDHDAFDGLHGAKRSAPFPMAALPPSYVDRQFSQAIDGTAFEEVGIPFGRERPERVVTPLRVTTVPQAKNSDEYDDRPACDGRSSCIPLCPIDAKYEARIHVERAKRKGVELRARSVVNYLEPLARGRGWRVQYRPWHWRDGRARRDGGDRTVSAAIVVVAANAIETPKLLLMSPVDNRSGQIGRNLMDHPGLIAYAQAKEPVYPFRGPPTTSSIESLRDGPFRAFRGAFRTAIRNDGWAMANGAPNGWSTGSVGDPTTLLDLVGKKKLFGRELLHKLFERTQRQILIGSALEMLPEPNNRVRPDPTRLDDLDVPRPRIDFRIGDDEYTRATFEAVNRFHAEVFTAMDATEQHLGSAAVPDLGSCHAMGTTRMGDDEATSVVDPYCRVHGHPDLFIVGGSVFPTSSSANPTATVAALALRVADTIRGALRERTSV
jgi:choline dehydrogenase-like flavoprotein